MSRVYCSKCRDQTGSSQSQHAHKRDLHNECTHKLTIYLQFLHISPYHAKLQTILTVGILARLLASARLLLSWLQSGSAASSFAREQWSRESSIWSEKPYSFNLIHIFFNKHIFTNYRTIFLMHTLRVTTMTRLSHHDKPLRTCPQVYVDDAVYFLLALSCFWL